MAHETVLTIFVIIAALALVLQGLAMFGLYKVVQRMQGEIANIRAELAARINPLAETLTGMITEAREPLRMITADLAEVTRVLRERAGSVDDVLDDLVDRFRLQVIRVDKTITDVL